MAKSNQPKIGLALGIVGSRGLAHMSRQYRNVTAEVTAEVKPPH